jgi:hypothetical protein
LLTAAASTPNAECRNQKSGRLISFREDFVYFGEWNCVSKVVEPAGRGDAARAVDECAPRDCSQTGANGDPANATMTDKSCLGLTKAARDH